MMEDKPKPRKRRKRKEVVGPVDLLLQKSRPAPLTGDDDAVLGGSFAPDASSPLITRLMARQRAGYKSLSRSFVELLGEEFGIFEAQVLSAWATIGGNPEIKQD